MTSRLRVGRFTALGDGREGVSHGIAHSLLLREQSPDIIAKYRVPQQLYYGE